MGEHLQKLQIIGYEIYPINQYFAFAVTEEKILMVTPLTVYLITHTQLNSKAGHARIRAGVLNREYKSIGDVLTDMRLNAGVGVSYRLIDTRTLYV